MTQLNSLFFALSRPAPLPSFRRRLRTMRCDRSKSQRFKLASSRRQRSVRRSGQRPGREPQLESLGNTAEHIYPMIKVSYPVSLRLATREIEQLKARAHRVSGTLTGIARELIVTGLAGGDNKELAERLMIIERRLVVLEGLARDLNDRSARIEAMTRDQRAKFDALLNALSSEQGAA
jgi:hypothetical protein